MLQYTCISTYKNNINSKFVRFDDNFNEPFENYNNYQNNEITHIIFGYKFNKSLNYINLFSSNLISITLGICFNQTIEHLKLCKNLKLLIISGNFNQNIDNLPNSIEYLEINGYFNKPIEKFPDNLKKLTLDGVFNQSIDNSAKCMFIEFIKLGDFFNNPLNILSNSLHILVLGRSFNQSVNIIYKLYNLKQLILGTHFNQIIRHFPMSLEYINFGFHYNQKIYNLPKHIKRIHFGLCFNKPINKLLYSNLKHLTLGNMFTYDISQYLPNSLCSLEINTQFKNFNITHLVNLQCLIIHSNYILDEFKYNLFLPLNIISITLDTPFILYDINMLPLNLFYIKLTSNYKKISDISLLNNITWM